MKERLDFKFLVPTAISIIALYLALSQHSIDYSQSVITKPGQWPVSVIAEKDVNLGLEIINTSNKNLQYYLKVNTTIGCIDGSLSKPQLFSCIYESQIIRLSKSGASNNSFEHELRLLADHRSAEQQYPFIDVPSPDYLLEISVIDAANGKTLLHHSCFYSYSYEAKEFRLYQPIIDSTGESQKLQESCGI
ncbi:hypothetical protein AKJ18_19685 [Vibrio xuii]|nr:hypothetical protein AKJ18_19685 [Vibrio xuii]